MTPIDCNIALIFLLKKKKNDCSIRVYRFFSLTLVSICNYLGPAHNFGPYYLNHTTIDTTATHKDLGILFDECLKFHDHTTEVTAKANKVLGMVKRSFEHLNSCMISKLFTGAHILFWTSEKWKKFSVELPNWYLHYKTSHTKNGYQLYHCHHYLVGD